jgi:hypothetical protein
MKCADCPFCRKSKYFTNDVTCVASNNYVGPIGCENEQEMCTDKEIIAKLIVRIINMESTLENHRF